MQIKFYLWRFFQKAVVVIVVIVITLAILYGMYRVLAWCERHDRMSELCVKNHNKWVKEHTVREPDVLTSKCQ